MGDEIETPARPRTSRFKEHTNTTSSIHPPPDELWRDLGIEDMIEKFNEESRAPPTRKGALRTITPPAFSATSVAGPGVFTSAAPATPAANEGTFGRFSRAWASVFGDHFRSVLGKRKAGNADVEREKENKVPDREKQMLDERKQAADQAYQARKLAQEQGLLPTPKVFVRPTATPRSHKCVVEHIAPASTPRTPSLYRSSSKKDLYKQKKLSKRVSDLECKLASARKELQTVLHSDLPPVPPLPATLPNTPITSQSTHIFSENEASQDTEATTPAPSQQPIGKITKKRKATTADDEAYKPIPTDSEMSDIHSASEPERTIKRAKSTKAKKLKRQSSRLSKKLSRSGLKKEEVVRIVPDGKTVPPLPSIPNGVQGKMARVQDDGYGGLEHEMF